MADKVTTMVLKVDLQCPRCYRKIKKVLCKFPGHYIIPLVVAAVVVFVWRKRSPELLFLFSGLKEIRDQIYDEKQNRVVVTVVTCCPEVILKRIASKGGRSVEGIEILPEKKKEGDKDKPKDAAAGGDKKKDAPGPGDKPKDAPSAGDKKKDAGGDSKPKDAPAGTGEKKKDAGGDNKPKDAAGTGEKKKDAGGDKPKQAPADKKPEAQVHKDVFEPVSGYPTIYPSGMFYDNQPYYPGYVGGGGGGGGIPMPMPCYHGHGRPCMCYGVPAYEGYVGNRGGGYSNPGRFDYFSEENPEACSIM